MLRLVLLCAVATLVKAQTTNVQQCLTNSGQLPINAFVEGCSVPPCRVVRGNDAVIHLIFKAPRLMRRMETRVVAQVPLLGDVPFPLGDEAETCNFLQNSFCPILPEEVLQYTLRLTIPIFTPALTVMIEFYIVDEYENIIMCIRVPVAVAEN